MDNIFFPTSIRILYIFSNYFNTRCCETDEELEYNIQSTSNDSVSANL